MNVIPLNLKTIDLHRIPTMLLWLAGVSAAAGNFLLLLFPEWTFYFRPYFYTPIVAQEIVRDDRYDRITAALCIEPPDHFPEQQDVFDRMRIMLVVKDEKSQATVLEEVRPLNSLVHCGEGTNVFRRRCVRFCMTEYIDLPRGEYDIHFEILGDPLNDDGTNGNAYLPSIQIGRPQNKIWILTTKTRPTNVYIWR